MVVRDTTFLCCSPYEVTTHFAPELPLHDLHPQPSAKPGIRYTGRIVNFAHSKFPASLLHVVHTLALEDVKAMQEFGLGWREVPIAVHIKLVEAWK